MPRPKQTSADSVLISFGDRTIRVDLNGYKTTKGAYLIGKARELHQKQYGKTDRIAHLWRNTTSTGTSATEVFWPDQRIPCDDIRGCTLRIPQQWPTQGPPGFPRRSF